MMKVNVSEIAEITGREVPYAFTAKPEDIGPLLDGCRLEGPIMVKGTAVNTGSCFRLEGEIGCNVVCVCDRCLADYQTAGNYSFTEEFSRDKDTAKQHEINYFVGDIIDIGDLVRDIIISSQPVKHLCKDDCKGLCPVCGADLNKADCGCRKVSVDPRLAALQSLLKDK